MTFKYSPALMAALAAFDWALAIGIGFGFVAGWTGAASLFANDPNGGRKMLRQFKASLMAFGIGLLIVLWAVRVANLDPLGAATVAAFMGVLGVNGVEIIRGGARNWLRGFVQSAGTALGEEADAEQRRRAQEYLEGRGDD